MLERLGAVAVVVLARGLQVIPGGAQVVPCSGHFRMIIGADWRSDEQQRANRDQATLHHV